MNIIQLTCQSCGAALELDSNRDFAFCQFCGTKIMLKKNAEDANDSRKIQNYFELLDVAMQNGDFKEAKRYANLILELDVKQYQAWDKLCENLEKSKEIFFPTYEGFGEYLKYMKKALAYYDKPDTMAYAKSLENRFRLFLKDFIAFVHESKVSVPQLSSDQYPLPNFWPNGAFSREDKIFFQAIASYKNEISADANFDKLHALYFQVKVHLQNLSLQEFIRSYHTQQTLAAYREIWRRPKMNIYCDSDTFRQCWTICYGFKEVFKTIASNFEVYRSDIMAGKYVEIDLLDQTNQDVLKQIDEALKTAYSEVVEVANTMSGLKYNFIGVEDRMQMFQRTGDCPSGLERVNGCVGKEQRAELNAEIQFYRTKLAALSGQNLEPKKKRRFGLFG